MTTRIGFAVVLVALAPLFASDKSTGLPAAPIVEGRVPSRAALDFNQAPMMAAPRLLPASILEPKPRVGPEVAAIAFAEALSAVQLLLPIGLAPSCDAAKANFIDAERCRRNCKSNHARLAYQSVIAKAPGSVLALVAARRLEGVIIPVGLNESREPPLADGLNE